MPFSPLACAVMTKLADDVGVTDPSRQTFYGILGAALPSPVGIGIAMALANQEGESTPTPQPVPKALTINSPQQLPAAADGVAYNYTFQATGGTTPYTWTVNPASLPASGNFSLAANGILSGTADKGGADDGSYPLLIQVTDSAKNPATVSSLFLLQVGAGAANLKATSKQRRRRP